ncbi:efflux RND transporter periplasmic adaptor subunit [Leeia sp.]|uniref:efflux RND transporter periplasmic adaptor subunit n=1 Tax=Leeia sp. TaxID=2884678 RepID=UPI0035B1D376
MDNTHMPSRLPRYLPILALPLLLAACNKPAEAPYEDIRQVKLMTVSTTAAADPQQLAGEVRPRHEVRLSFRVAGKVTARLVNVGDTVKNGQVLARLDATDYQLGSAAARAQQDAASVERQQNDRDLARFRQLRDQGFISQAEFERRKAALDSSNARLKQTEAQAQSSGNQARYTELRAEQDGVISQLDLEAGQVVAAGQVIGKLSAGQELELVVAVPESQRQQLASSNGLTVSLWANPGKAYLARLRELSPEADAVTRTFTARVTIVDADSQVHAGMSGQLRLPQTAATGVALPISALYSQGNRSGVWVYDSKSGKVHLQAVRHGALQGNLVRIQQGIQPGQQVVAAGANLLREGQKVRPVEGL